MKKVVKKIKKHHIREVIVYGMVGSCSWIVQTVIYVLLVRIFVFPSIAMILGNFGGLIVSYMGHTRFTFQKANKFTHKDFIKFFVTSLIGLGVNVSGVRIITKVLVLNPHYAIIPTIFTPGLTFLISKFWVFR